MSNPIVVKNLSKNYSKKEAVKNINFEIEKNEILGLLGPNGCGKTTTIAMMLGLLKPTKGQVLINGMDIETNRIRLLHKMNFISPYIELPKKLTVRENLTVYGKLYGVLNIKNRLDYLIEKLRLAEFINKKTGELSSGQKNRASLAKALIFFRVSSPISELSRSAFETVEIDTSNSRAICFSVSLGFIFF